MANTLDGQKEAASRPLWTKHAGTEHEGGRYLHGDGWYPLKSFHAFVRATEMGGITPVVPCLRCNELGEGLNSTERKEIRRLRRMEQREARRQKLLEQHTFSDVVSLDALVRASRLCKRGVSWKRSVQGFHLNRTLNCVRLKRQIESGSYRVGSAKRFVISERGKRRNISAVPYADRVVQRSLCDNVLVPVVSRSLITDNGASLPGKGTSFARERLRSHLKDHWKHYGMHGYIVLFDYSHFFESIDAKQAAEMIGEHVGEGPCSELASKYLLDEEQGLGLGNQTSQTAAILYASPIDHWAKEVARVRGYGRYMDDGYALFRTLQGARLFAEELRSRSEILRLELNPKKVRILRISQPFIFLKTRFQLLEDGSISCRVCAEALKREKRRIRSHARLVSSGVMRAKDAAQSYASWRGTLLRGDAYRFLQHKMDKYFEEHLGVPWHSAVCESEIRIPSKEFVLLRGKS